MFHALQLWLGSLRVAGLVRDIVWVKALLESVHILANGLLLFSATMICTRLAGFAGGTRALEPTIRRFSPFKKFRIEGEGKTVAEAWKNTADKIRAIWNE